jgi:hypothetical protein
MEEIYVKSMELGGKVTDLNETGQIVKSGDYYYLEAARKQAELLAKDCFLC